MRMPMMVIAVTALSLNAGRLPLDLQPLIDATPRGGAGDGHGRFVVSEAVSAEKRHEASS